VGANDRTEIRTSAALFLPRHNPVFVVVAADPVTRDGVRSDEARG